MRGVGASRLRRSAAPVQPSANQRGISAQCPQTFSTRGVPARIQQVIGRSVFIGLAAAMRDGLSQRQRDPSLGRIHARNVEAFENAQRGRQRVAMALAANGADLPASVGAAHHLTFQRLICREVVARQRAAHAAQMRDQPLTAATIHHRVRPVAA